MLTPFTPYASLLGGTMIGLAAVLLMASHGRIAGVSDIAVRMFPPWLDGEAGNRVLFILGLVAAPLVYSLFAGHWASFDITVSPAALIVGGFVAGFGAVWGNGCTSGHGICGLSRLSKRSFAAVAIFMTTAFVTVFITRHLL